LHMRETGEFRDPRETAKTSQAKPDKHGYWKGLQLEVKVMLLHVNAEWVGGVLKLDVKRSKNGTRRKRMHGMKRR